MVWGINCPMPFNTGSMKQLILSSKKLRGSLTLIYENDVLKSFTNAFKTPLNAVQETEIKRLLQFDFSKIDLGTFAAIGLEVAHKGITNGGERVASFCGAYKQKYGSCYTVSAKEGAMLKKLSLKSDTSFEELVKSYLECPEWRAQPKSIGEMLSRINELRQWVCAPKADAKAPWHFPDGYSKTREQECKTNEELQAYWRHLRAQDYQKTRIGTVETWKKVTSKKNI